MTRYPMRALRAMRLRRELTQSRLADKSGYAQEQIAQWENGTKAPQLVTLRKLAKVLRCSVADLIDDPPIRRDSFA